MSVPNTEETRTSVGAAAFLAAWHHVFHNTIVPEAAWVTNWLHRAARFHPEQDFTPERDWPAILDDLKYGDTRAAFPRLREIADQRPDWYACRWHLVRAYLILDQAATAEQVCRDWLTGAAGAMEGVVRVMLSVAYQARGDVTQAWAVVSTLAERLAKLSDDVVYKPSIIPVGFVPAILEIVGSALAGVGRLEEAERWYQRSGRMYPSEYGEACIAALRGQSDRALQLLEGYVDRGLGMNSEWLRADPDFASLRDDPRFVALAQRNIDDARARRPRRPDAP